MSESQFIVHGCLNLLNPWVSESPNCLVCLLDQAHSALFLAPGRSEHPLVRSTAAAGAMEPYRFS